MLVIISVFLWTRGHCFSDKINFTMLFVFALKQFLVRKTWEKPKTNKMWWKQNYSNIGKTIWYIYISFCLNRIAMAFLWINEQRWNDTGWRIGAKKANVEWKWPRRTWFTHIPVHYIWTRNVAHKMSGNNVNSIANYQKKCRQMCS